MAKDVVTFLNWAAEPEHDERKKAGIKAVILFSALTAISLYVKRYKWSYIKSRKISASPCPSALFVTTPQMLLPSADMFQLWKHSARRRSREASGHASFAFQSLSTRR